MATKKEKTTSTENTEPAKKRSKVIRRYQLHTIDDVGLRTPVKMPTGEHIFTDSIADAILVKALLVYTGGEYDKKTRFSVVEIVTRENAAESELD